MGEQRPVHEGQRFGQFLRRIRENRKLSLDAAAEMTSSYPGQVTKSHLSRIENGRAEPTFPRMFALSRAYGVPIAQFAERFEADLRRALAPDPLTVQPSAEMFCDAEAQRAAGRHDDALIRYELLLERKLGAGCDDQPEQSLATLRLRRVNCLMMLSRYASAKDEAEELMARPDLTPDERASALQLFAQCCYRIERYQLALMAVGQAEVVIATLPETSPHHAHLTQLKGNLHFVMGDPKAAATAFRAAIELYEQVGPDYEVCRHRTNYAQALAECGQHKEAGRQLRVALKHAEARGYERTRTYTLSALGSLAFRLDQFEAAESYCLQSNVRARKRDYLTLVFCNCYYLWRIALERGDATSAASNERTLRAYVERMPEHIAEVRLYREQVAGGAS